DGQTVNGQQVDGATTPPEKAAANPTQVTGDEPSRQARRQTQLPQTVAEQRADALAAYWLKSAAELRASGKLELARDELLQAKAAAPNNPEVATQLAAVLKELGQPDAAPSDPPSANQVALATVRQQLQNAQTHMATK